MKQHDHPAPTGRGGDGGGSSEGGAVATAAGSACAAAAAEAAAAPPVDELFNGASKSKSEPVVAFSIEELRAGTPAGVDSAHKEAHLSAAEFEAHLGATRGAWERLPRWKRDADALLRHSPIAAVPGLAGVAERNYVLQYDARYAELWRWYERLRRQDDERESLAPWQHRPPAARKPPAFARAGRRCQEGGGDQASTDEALHEWSSVVATSITSLPT